MSEIFKETLRALVRAYRYFISPLLPPACRFHPGCADYAEQALQEHGAMRGGWLTACRLCRCGPWSPGGVDPVPARQSGGESVARGPLQGRK